MNHLVIALSHLNLPTVQQSSDNVIPILQTKGKAKRFSDSPKVIQLGGLNAGI